MDLLASIIAGLITLAGTIVTVTISNNSTKKLIEYRIEQVERRLDSYNNHSERLALIESNLKAMWKKVDDLYDKLIT